MYINSRLNGEKTALIAAGAQKYVFTKPINGEKAVIGAKWTTRTQFFAETVFGAFRNVPGERWKNRWIRIF
jgi:hypothetical protein